MEKTAKGVTAKKRATKAQEQKKYERNAKDLVRERDHRACRWPSCNERGTDVAHLTHKGMGGDPKSLRTQAQSMILFCKTHHQGTNGLDQGKLSVVPMTPKGTSGPCEFIWANQREHFRLYSVKETKPCVVDWSTRAAVPEQGDG